MYLEVLKHGEMFDFRFEMLIDNKKSMTQGVSGCTLTGKLPLMYLNGKLLQERCH